MSKKREEKYFDAQKFVNRQIELRTYAALKQKNAQFAEDHARDTDERLLEYLRRNASDLGQAPNPEEIIGGDYIGRRFGGYRNAVKAAGLSAPGSLPPPTSREIFKKELKIQAKLHRAEKTAVKARKAEKRRKKSKNELEKP